MISSKAKLLVILGAGSSIPLGMPCVATVNDSMKEWSRYFARSRPSFFDGTQGGAFNDLWDIAEQYYQCRLYRDPVVSVDFEKVIRELMAIVGWVTPSPQGNVLRKAVRDGNLLDRLRWYSSAHKPYECRIAVIEEVAYLISRLAADFRERSRALDNETTAFQTYRAMLKRLRREFDVGIYNLNYDAVALSTWPSAFTGFSGAGFDPGSVIGRNEWGFIYHLHGSVHHSLDVSNRIIWIDDLGSAGFRDASPEDPRPIEAFRPIIPATIVAGGSKLDQLLADPFQTFYATLVRHVHEADAILIVGYGFGDVHVNTCLEKRCNRLISPQSRPPQIVVIDKSEEPAGNRNDLWGLQLARALGTSFKSQPHHFEPLEHDLQQRVAIWRGGIIEADQRGIDDMIAWLRRPRG